MRHYDTLDALRGVAALAVVVFHMRAIGITSEVVPHGYLAVDFFFELSGFVLAFAYRRKLAGAMGFGDFAVRRAVRIYPLALAGVGIGVSIAIAQNVRGLGGRPLPDILSSAAFNLFLLPDPVSAAPVGYALYPGDDPIWSLFFELSINLAWAAALWRLRKVPLALLCALSGAWLVAQTTAHGTADLGASWLTAWGGAARVCFGFLLGTLIEIAGWYLPAPSSPRFGVVLGAVLAAVFCVPVIPAVNAPYDLACIAAVFPLVILCGMTQSAGGAVSTFLGRVSYPLYAVHYPLLVVARLFWRAAAGHVPLPLFCALVVASCLLAAHLALRFYDEPVRRRLTAALPRRAGRRAAADGATQSASPSPSEGG